MLPDNTETIKSIIIGMSVGIAYSRTYTLKELFGEQLDFYGTLRILMVMAWMNLLLTPIFLVLFWNGW